jgi:hypothetical protein
MNALPLITVTPIVPPAYINRNIDNKLQWLADNDYHLKFYFEALMDSMPADERMPDPFQFRLAQYSEERMRLRIGETLSQVAPLVRV